MCGIAGCFGVSQSGEEQRALLKRMCDSMIYRGPDDEGYFVDGAVGLGMRRLSIIDLSGGRQPVTNEGKNIWVVLNGEIYNFATLREDLQRKGHQFTSRSDTEVIVHQYEEDGADCVQKFNGMFAFAVWDQRSQTLLLARDRLGIKPLYYYWDGTRLLFASEIKALLASGLIQKELEPRALWDYLTLGHVPQPETIWKHIHKLLPGHTLSLSRQKPEPVIRRYWDIPYTSHPIQKSFAEYSREFNDLFLDAVRLHLIADVPVGVLLSGGLDSSAVAAAVKEVHNARLDSFSVAFENSAATNELPYARLAAERVGTNHHEVIIGQKDFLDFLPRFVHYMDEPMADLASVPLHYVSQLARQHVKVVLSGEGSDETLGGYDFERVVRNWDRAERFQQLPKGLRQALVKTAGLFGPPISEYARKADTPVNDRLQTQPAVMTNLFTSEQKRRLYKTPHSYEDSLDRFRADFRRNASLDPLHQALYVYCQSWLVDDLLSKADRMTMASSLELRVPFLDYRLVNWLAAAPASVKVGRDSRGVYQTKRLLREFARTRLPAEILSRPKQGFPVPVYGWLQGPLKSWATDLLQASDARITRWFSPEEIHRWTERGTAANGSSEDQHRLWPFLILELWMKEWMS